MTTRIPSARGFSIAGIGLTSTARVHAPKAEELDKKADGDGFLSAAEIAKASTEDLHILQGQLDGEAYYYAHYNHSAIPFHDSGLASAASGAGDVVDEELVKRERALPRMSTGGFGGGFLSLAPASGWTTNEDYNQGLSDTIHGPWKFE